MSNTLKSFLASFFPIIVFTVVAMTQLRSWGYYELGRIIVFIQAAYVLLLIPAIIVFLVMRKGDIAGGLAISFGIGFFVAIVALGMGL